MRINWKKGIIEVIILSFAVLIIAAAVYFFLIPSRTTISSISAVAVVLNHYIPLPVSAINLIINVFLLILGFFLIGREFGIKTVYTSILLPVYLAIFEKVWPDLQSLTGSDIIDVIACIFFISIGVAILFHNNASSGGMDIVAKIMNKYLHMDLGRAVSISGVAVGCLAVFIYDKRSLVLSILGSYFSGLLLDHFIFGQEVKRRVCIVSENHMEELQHFIVNDLHSGATLYEGTGAYTGEKRMEIITIVDKHEYQKLMDFIIRTDPDAFVTVYNVSNMRYRKK
ncbi:MAG: YitT family protein, partial [Lachnospiraceae bacterium]|nr:YitT family protein [Lachnospiraceae bacterium]